MKKALKWAGIILGIPVALILILAMLFYVPPVQRWVLGEAIRVASEKTGMEITIDHVRLAFPLDLSMEDVRIIRQNDSLPQVKDTIAAARRMVADVQLWPLLHQKVEVDELMLENLRLNTSNLIAAARVKGTVGRLALVSHGIDLRGPSARVNEVAMDDARLQVLLPDSVPPDTTESKTLWKIAVDSLDIRRSAVTVHFPGDTLQVSAYMGKAIASKGTFDLGEGVYRVRRFDWTDGRLNYDNKWKAQVSGLDYNHLALTDITVGIDSLVYQAPKLDMNVRQMAFKEKSGIDLQQLSGPIAMDSTKLYLRDIRMKTSGSSLRADFNMDLNSFSDTNPGKLNAKLHASLGKHDLMRFMGSMPAGFRKQWPNAPLAVSGVVRGNLRHMQFDGLRVKLPTAIVAHASGYADHLDDPQRLKADVTMRATTGKLDFVKTLLDAETRKTVRIPQGIGLEAQVKVNGKQYASTFTVRQGGGRLRGTAQLDAAKMAYAAKLSADRLPLQNFLPNQGLHPLSAAFDVKGRGTDFLSPHTTLMAKGKVTRFRYGQYNLDNVTADVNVRNGHAKALVYSDNPLVRGSIAFDALTRSRNINATVSTDLQHVDLYHLRLADDTMSIAVRSRLGIATDLKDFYKVNGRVDGLTVNDNGAKYTSDPIHIDLLTRRDTIDATVRTGDFCLDMQSRQGYKQLVRRGNGFMAELRRQLADRKIDESRLRERLPDAKVYLATGRNNLVANLMRKYALDMDMALVNMVSSPVSGMNGKLLVGKLLVDSIQLDTVRLSLHSTSEGTTYHGVIQNVPGNPQYVFRALVDGSLNETGTSVSAKLYDEKDRLGIALGLRAEMEQGGIRTRLDSTKLVLGYKDFAVNAGNYVFLGDDRRVSANVMLRADDGTGIQLSSNDGNRQVLQDVTLSMHKIGLEKIMSVIPYAPDIAGTLDGDFHVIQTADELSISSSVAIRDMLYEQNAMGNLSSEFVYMPKANGSHYIDGILSSEGQEVATVSGTYKKNGTIDATLGLERMPLHLVNGFIPDRIIGLQGYGDGDLTLKGSLKNPHVDGEIFLDSSYIVSEPYGVSMRFADDPVRITDSKLVFENFEMFASNNSPLNISGTFDFSDMDRMMLDIRMRAENFELIDARENPRSEAYGKAFVDFFGTMRGPVDNLRLRGMLNVLGTTDMTYVLKDTELATDNQLDELVKFTDFNDSIVEVVRRPKPTGFDMGMSITIDEAARIVCMLNADHTNYIDLLGGGNLLMRYNPTDNLRLTGRYTLNSGEMKYSLPVIPLKTFNIQNGSYIEFTGDPMNPSLNITATEKMKANVNEGTGAGRQVDFEAGVKLSQTLDSPGIQFIINAPNDMAIQDELNTMTAEGRGKVAITMLASGMYLTDGNTAAFSMNSALSSYLQSEINNIAGSAMRSMGLDIGMSVDNTTTNSGAMHTDYNFRFAKRLWNNRLRVIIGGRVSSGEELMADKDDSFFDNVELEYRLNQNASQYLRLFYNNNTYDWLEGMIGEYGVGFTWRRKLAHFKDILRFRSDKQALPSLQPAKKDSVKNESQKED